jgi:hypothetical protein
VNIKVTRNGVDSNIEPVTIAATTAPSLFLSDFTNGLAWMTGPGCETAECAGQPGVAYQLWGTGFGPKNSPQQDGVPAVGSLTQLAVPGSPAACQLTIGGRPAVVNYCGAGPGEIIDKLNFTYPHDVSTASAYVDATLIINGVTGRFRVPAPNSGQRATLLLQQMTQTEKLQLVAGAGGPITNIRPLPRGAGGWIPGIPRLGIPDLYFCDGSVGVANSQAPATALPSSIASAATGDLNLAYQYGKVIGTEMAAYGLNVNLGGNINLIGREPRDGRTFETKGEDPTLAGKITAAYIRAIQDQHVLGGMKHFSFNDQETGRFTANVRIDERSGRESDPLAFEIALKDSNVQSVMCSYNLVDSVYSCENPHLTMSSKATGAFRVSSCPTGGRRTAPRPRRSPASTRNSRTTPGSQTWSRPSKQARCHSRVSMTWSTASCAPCSRPGSSTIRLPLRLSIPRRTRLSRSRLRSREPYC